MSRSLKKPPFVHYKLMQRVEEAQESQKKAVIKTYYCCSQRKQIYSGLCNRKHGRTQVRRVCTDKNL
jgi:small subunit ribosomal protein S19